MAYVIKAQPGICAEPSLHALIVLLHVTSEAVDKVRQTLAQFPRQSEQLANRFSEAMLTCTLGVGEPYWDVLSPSSRPDGLKNIPDYVRSEHPLPVTPFDLVLVIRSDRMDANYLAGLQLVNWLGDIAEVAEQHRPFRCLDGRDLFGFRYMNEQMPAPQRRELSLINVNDDPEFAGGSCFWVLMSRLAVQRFSALSVAEQERIIGRERLSGKLLQSQKSVNHANKTAATMWRLHMPFGDLKRSQELTLLFSKQMQTIDDWVRHRFSATDEQPADPRLNYENIEHASAYFAPPLQWFEQLK